MCIRDRNNRASILNERCIDCGECIKVCANHAKVAVTDPLESIKRFKYPIALPAPTLYAQFQGVHQPEPIIASLFRLGFVDVFEVARAAEIVSYAISRAMREEDRPKPVISSACPAILRLIQVSFPALLDNVIDFVSPMEAAAKIAKEEYAQKHGVDKADVGVFFITPLSLIHICGAHVALGGYAVAVGAGDVPALAVQRVIHAVHPADGVHALLPVSYTHLDVYKRQLECTLKTAQPDGKTSCKETSCECVQKNI